MTTIFNELSIIVQQNKFQARAMMECFVMTYLHSLKNGVSEIRLHESVQNIYSWTLCPEYLVSQWKEDPEVDKPLKSRFKSIILKSPIFEEHHFVEAEEFKDSEFFFEEAGQLKNCSGLAAAYIYDTPAISLDSAETWQTSTLGITHNYVIANEDNVEIKSELRSIKHFYNIETFNSHNDWIEEQYRESTKTASDLWLKREELFPNLIFCGETEKQLQNNTISGKFFKQIYSKLGTLNKIASEWKLMNGVFDARWASANYPIEVGEESECTLNRYGTDRSFKLPDGQYETFELHIKFQTNIRIHFFCRTESREVFVGYIGKHLPICSE